MKKRSEMWVDLALIAAGLAVLMSFIVLNIKFNLMLVLPCISISFNIAILIFIIKEEEKRMMNVLRDSVWRFSFFVTIFSLLSSISLLGIWLCEWLSCAMIFAGFYIFFISSIMVFVLSFTMLEPQNIFERKLSLIAIHGLYLAFPVFITILYFTNIFIYGYPKNITKFNGIYYELELTKAGFGHFIPYAKEFMMAVNLFILFFGAIQYSNIRNIAIKKYYLKLYIILFFIILIALTNAVIINYILGMHYISFSGILTFLLSFSLVYYAYNIKQVFSEMEKIQPIKKRMEGKISIYPLKERQKAIYFVKKLIKNGYKAIIFSYDEKIFRYFDDEKGAVLYIHVFEDGYRIENSFFRSIEDIENMAVFPKTLAGIVIYSETLSKVMSFPCRRRKEMIRYYRLLFRAIEEGGVVVAPICEKYLNKGGVTHSKTPPLWDIKPIVALRLEEVINLIYRESKADTKNFLNIIKSLERDGFLRAYMEEKRICLDLEQDIDKERFSLVIKALEGRLSDSGIMDPSEFRNTLKKAFEDYGEEFYSVVMTWKGELNFVATPNPRERVMKMAKSLEGEGSSVLVISRVNPHILRRKYSLSDKFTLKWLTTSESEHTLYPHLENIKREVFSFIEKHQEGVVVMDGAEYLLKMHGFEALLNLFWILQDRLATTQVIALIPISPAVFEKRDIEILKRDFHFIE